MVSIEVNEEEEGEGMQQKISLVEALTHIHKIIRYIEEQEVSLLYINIRLKNLHSQIKNSFEVKKQRHFTDILQKSYFYEVTILC